MKPPVHVQTKFGFDYLNYIQNEFNENKENGLLEFFKDLCSVEMDRISSEIGDFLDSDDAAIKHKMNDEDEDGWSWFKGMSDKFVVLSYFKQRK